MSRDGHRARRNRPGSTGKILRDPRYDEPARGKQRRNPVSLPGPGFERHNPIGSAQSRQIGDDGAIGVETVNPAIQGEGRIVEADVGIEAIDIRCANIRRVGHDDVETSPERIAPITAQHSGAIGEATARHIRGRRPTGGER